ncbi:MAG: flagellar protein FliT [Candidatus Nitricoxidivorans perseverans]|uniref:Flagellar protein FliT n=1 Tax=Candidatus Nitricoxidivorans perseverans TaxID=2975601 RepID=A0AA49FNB0_9PROT|nr:MAG: flagellar protein FliT [Candidatus Nitricoxidivorans perseverans]
MLRMPSQIELYEEMSALSARMVEAAQCNDWERLVALEHSVAALRDTLMAEDGASLSDDEIGLKRALIQRILDDDAEVRRHTEPWMEQVRQFLGGATTRRKVERAYGV